MSEYDRQMAIFAKKTSKPDRVIKGHSFIKAESDDGALQRLWVLSNDDTVTLIDLTDDEEEPND